TGSFAVLGDGSERPFDHGHGSHFGIGESSLSQPDRACDFTAMKSQATLETGMGEEKRQGVLLKAQHVSKSFGASATLTQALADGSLERGAGEATLLMGPSGSGKSTLLAILSGLLPPTEGTVNAMGEELWSLTNKERQEFRRRYCGFVFQGFNLFPALSAEQQ